MAKYAIWDTVIGSNTYLELGEESGLYLIREDTVLGRVYIRLSDSTDDILYDYNWRIGDTVRQPNLYGHDPVCWVVGLDSTMINGLWYKVWHFRGTDMSGGDLDYHVIEGIGCTNGLIFAIAPYRFFEYSEQLFCFSSRGVSYSLSVPVPSWGLLGDLNFDNSLSCGLPLSTCNITASHIVIFPNPAHDNFNITNVKMQSGFCITNILGESMLQGVLNVGDNLVSVSDFPSGVYLIHINGTEVRRFVKQ